MEHAYWPFYELTIRTPRLELRYADDDLVFALAAVAAVGIRTPDRMPFNEPWTRRPPGLLELGFAQYVWSRRATLSPTDWALPFAVIVDGAPVGVQEIFARDFPTRRSFETGSWLGIGHQGRGIGTEMRAAVLHLGFDELGARVAENGAFADNPASQRVTGKLGYVANGEFVRVREGEAATMRMFSMGHDDWRRGRRDDITVAGLDACRTSLGL